TSLDLPIPITRLPERRRGQCTQKRKEEDGGKSWGVRDSHEQSLTPSP
ncbi:MAG: hypothetical protein ACI8WY_003219, partial [Planctomycetota bacterium]